MIFVDTNVFMYAVGGEHPLKRQAREGLAERMAQGGPVCTSAEVLQELLHAYLPVGRLVTLAAALRMATDLATVLPVTVEDVLAARDLSVRHPGLSARDLIHLAVGARAGAHQVFSFDRALVAAWRN